YPGGRGCRRSSSDAAYEPAETAAQARAQHECHRRPHYSDPMPAKRKQLKMKMATVAATRLHSQRCDGDRDRDRDRHRDSAPAALRVHSEPRGEERAGHGDSGGGGGGPAQHRWSTVSSLSADSGVVGLGNELDDEDSEPRLQRQRQRQRHRRTGGGGGGGGGAGSEVEWVDSGIGPGLSRGWKRPSAELRAWEARQPCGDCGLREGERSGKAMCERCSKLRTERKEAILEFLSTEMSYGEDLRIIREEFYCPMQSAGLLTAEQLAVVFANTYCLLQSTSVNMLNALEKEKELLR
ncbi:hypothetical protein CRUP_027293, partial [Coryphaenoides rupestris]